MLQQMFEVTAKIRSWSLKPESETHVYTKASSATMQRGARLHCGDTRTLGAHRIK